MMRPARSRPQSATGQLTFVGVDHAFETGWPLLGVCTYWGEHGHPTVGRAASAARAELSRGTDVEAVVRAVYASLATTPAAALDEAAACWWDGLGAQPPLRPETLAVLAAARADGDRVVLVSNAFPSCLTGVVTLLEPGAAVLCSVAEREPSGHLTGQLTVAMTGQARTAAMDATARAVGVDLAACRAYGSGWADAEMLAAVGGIITPTDVSRPSVGYQDPAAA